MSEKRAVANDGSKQPAQQLKDLIARGKEQGYLTYAEVNDHLPPPCVLLFMRGGSGRCGGCSLQWGIR